MDGQTTIPSDRPAQWIVDPDGRKLWAEYIRLHIDGVVVKIPRNHDGASNAILGYRAGANMLAGRVLPRRTVRISVTYNDLLEDESIPVDDDPETLDVRDLPPPKPLQRTLEELQSLPDDGVLVQINDRVPQHLFDKLTERGYAYRTSDGDPVYTAIWRERD